MAKQVEVWHSEYELRQFIDTATRWPIEAVNKNKTKERPYSIFTDDIKVARNNFDLFADQLNKKLISTQNWKAIEIDLEDRFLKMLNQYINWYEENKESTKIFDKYNPYQLMLSVIESTKKEILKYFPETLPISNSVFDIKRFEIEIRKQPSITAKLDYWHNILTTYIDEPAEKIRTADQNSHDLARIKDKLLSQLFNDYSNSPFFPIPRSIYNEHFSDGLNNPEFTYWFLKYNAKKYFETTYNIKRNSTRLGKEKTKVLLDKFNDFEKSAEELLINDIVDINNPEFDFDYFQEIEWLRIKHNYYKTNALPNVNSIGNTTVIIYANHIYYKKYITPTIKVNYSNFNEAEISENTSWEDFSLDNIRLETICTIEGFTVYLSKIERAEDYFVNSNIDLNNDPFRNIFEEYFQRTFSEYLKKTKTLFKLNEHDFKEYLYNKEKENLANFKKYISYFVTEETVQFMLLKKSNEFLDWLKPQVQDIDSTKVEDSILFSKNNYESEIRNWNKKHDNNLTKWLESGQMIKIEEWLFVNKDILIDQKAVLNDLYDLIRLPIIKIADMHDEVKQICYHSANSIEDLLDQLFVGAKNIQITSPFSSLCPKIIKQPYYLVEADFNFPKELPEHKKIYYRHEYLKVKFGFGKDMFLEYRKDLNKRIKIEISNKNKDIINSMFLFIEQFIDELNSLHRTHFSYFVSPLFRLLFDEVIKAKGYYFNAFGHFNFKNVLETETLLKSAENFAENDLQVNNHENDLLEIFHKIIKGNLKPHLFKEDNLTEINNLLKIASYFDEKSNTIKTDDEYWSLTTENDQSFEISLDADNPDNNIIKFSPDESLETLINLNIPPPPDEKSEAFLKLIERENLLIKARAYSFLKDSNSTEENKLFAFKNIQLLKELSGSLYTYIKKLGGEHGNLFITDANHFITYVLKYYIIDAIQFFQQIFQPFTNKDVESSTNLKLLLFHESTPRIPEFTILPLLPKKKEFEIFKKNLHFKLNSNRQYKPELSIGEKLFNFYKSKNNDLSKEHRLIEYNKNLIFWNNLLITNKLKTIVNDRYINEPEIEKILIPLLKGEIEILDKQIKISSPDTHFSLISNDLPIDEQNPSIAENQLLSDTENSLFVKNLAIIENYATSVENKFITTKDYNLFTETLAKFFSGISYNKDITIKLKLRSKTAVAQILNPIHKNIGNVETLVNNTKYFEIIRILEPFKDYDDNKIYRMLIK